MKRKIQHLGPFMIFVRAFLDLCQTQKALIIRDFMIRYKREGIGFGWLVIEPMILTVMVMLMWTTMYGSSKQGVGVVPLVLTGYSFLTLWRHTVGRSIYVLKMGYDLKFHRAIQYGDIILTRYLLEFLAVQLAFWIAYIILLLVGWVKPIYDLFLIIQAWLLFGFLSMGVGIIIASATELSESVERFVTPAMYITIPLTGAFYMVSWMPYSVQSVFLWSPMIHGVEMFRAGFFGPGVPTQYSAAYLFYVALVANGFGWLFFNYVKCRVEPFT